MSDLTTVDIKRSYDDNGKPMFTVTTPKMKTPIYITKTRDGFVFYEVTLQRGSAPEELSGKYTGPDAALKAVIKYIDKRKESPTAKRDRYSEMRKKENAAKTSTNSTGTVQQGSAD